jgi:hypothetical protein
LEGVQPGDELLLQRLSLDHSLLTVAVVAAGGALVAADAGARAAGAVHACAATLTVEELAQQVLLGGAAGLDDAGAPGADLLHLVEQLVGDDRVVQAGDGAVAAASAGDVPGVGGVAEHLAEGVLAELAVAVAADALGVQPGGERAV